MASSLVSPWSVGARRTRVVTLLVGIAAGVFSWPARAQTPAAAGAIAGTVTDRSAGTPVSGASVRALAISSRATIGAGTTSDAGRYRVGGLAPGVYAVVTARIGYEQQRVDTVRVAAGETVTLDFALVEAGVQLNQVVTTASRGGRQEKALEAPASISVITTEEIERRPATTPVDLLRSTPGIDATQGGLAQTNVVARGFNNAFSGSLLILQDYRFAGVPSLRVNVPVLMTGTMDDIERVEVLLGPASALYGPNSSNGVLHVITKSPFDFTGTSVTLEGGTRSFLRGGLRHAQALGERAAFKVSGEYLSGRDFEYRDPAEPDSIRRFNGSAFQRVRNARDFDLERYSGEARLDLRPGDNTEAITTVGYSNVGSLIELTGANGASQIRNWTYTNVQQRVRHKRLFAQLFANFSDAGNRDSLDTDGTFLLRSGQPIVDQSRVLSAQLQHGMELGRTDFVYGADYIFTDPRTGNTINGRNEDIDDVTEIGAYVQATHRLSSKIDLLGAIRVDRNNVIEDPQLSPRAAIVFKPSETHNFRATYNRAFATPANFSFFLDLIRQPIAGTPYNVRAIGNPPKEGIDYRRSCTAAVAGGLCMRSPFLNNGGEFVAAGGDQAYAALLGALTANSAALPATLRAVLPALGALRPASGAANLGVIAFPGQRPIDPASLQRIEPLEASFNDTYEVGYKGIVANRARFAVDLWYQRRGDVGAPAALATPGVFVDRARLGEFIRTSLPAVLQAGGQSAAVATATANAVGAAFASEPALAALFQLPLGVVTFDSPLASRATDLLATYQQLNQSIKVYGTDVAADFVATDQFTLSGTYSFLSQNVFRDIVDPATQRPYMANSPRHRGSVTARFDNLRTGFGVEVRGRYANAFPVNSGVYVSNTALTELPRGVLYPSVPVNALMDVGVSYRFTVGAQRALLTLNATNVLDNERISFVGTPAIGRLIMSRLRYEF